MKILAVIPARAGSKGIPNKNIRIIGGQPLVYYAIKNALLSLLTQHSFTAINAYAFMVFVLLYTPCVATIATMKREMKSTRWTVFAIVFQVLIAWLVATIFYQIANLLV